MCKAGNEGSQEHESFLQEMFPTVEVALVRDVLHNVQGDSEKACNQLLLIQVIECTFQVFWRNKLCAPQHGDAASELSPPTTTYGWCCQCRQMAVAQSVVALYWGIVLAFKTPLVDVTKVSSRRM